MRSGVTKGGRARAGLLAVVALLTVVFGTLLGAVPASAHDYLVSSTPKEGATITRDPGTVSLTFDAAVLNYGSGSTLLQVTGPGGRHFETACPTISDRTVSVAEQLGGPGRYTVTWRVVSSDGHPVSDSIAFTYRPASGATAAAGSATGPKCGGAVASAPAASTSAGTGGIVVLIVVVAAVLVALMIAAIVLAVVLTRHRA